MDRKCVNYQQYYVNWTEKVFIVFKYCASFIFVCNGGARIPPEEGGTNPKRRGDANLLINQLSRKLRGNEKTLPHLSVVWSTETSMINCIDLEESTFTNSPSLNQNRTIPFKITLQNKFGLRKTE